MLTKKQTFSGVGVLVGQLVKAIKEPLFFMGHQTRRRILFIIIGVEIAGQRLSFLQHILQQPSAAEAHGGADTNIIVCNIVLVKQYC